MKITRSALCPLLLCTSLLSALAATPPAEKLLPADTLAVITTPDYAKVRSTSAQAPYTLLWNDPALKPFREKFMAKLQSDVITLLEREFGIKFADYHGLAQGQVTLALTLNGWQGKAEKPPGFLFILDAKDKADTVKKNLADLKKKWVDNGKQIRNEKIRDVEFSTLIFSSDDFSKTLEKAFPEAKEKDKENKPKKEPRKLEWLVGQSESLLIVGSSAQDIENVLVHQSGGSAPSLAEQSAFANNYGKYFRDSLGYGWVDLKTILNVAMKAAAPPEGGLASLRPSPEKILKALGLGALETLSLNFNQASDGCSFLLHLQAPEASRQGLLKILSFENKDANPPSFVAADAVKFNRFRLNLQKSYAGIETMLGQIEPQYASLLKTMVDLAGKDKDPKFDLRTQLIDNLGDDLISYEKVPRRQTLEDLNSPPSLFLISSPKPEQLATAIGSLVSFLPMGSSGTKLKEREFLGRKVYTMNMGTINREGKRTDHSLYYSASGGYVGLSTDLPMLEEYLRGNSGKSLAEAPGLNEAAQKVGGMNTGLFGYENQKETSRATLDILKKESGTLANLFSASSLAGKLGMNENESKFKEWLDFSLLPPFDQIAKYFYIDVWSGSLNADGFTFKLFSPTPPELRK